MSNELSEVATKMREHFKERALMRLGLNLTDNQIKGIEDLIRSKQAKFIEPSDSREIWQLEFKKKRMRVVYSPKHESVITCYKCGFAEWYGI